MKKTFKLRDPKKAPARQVDSVKHDINKYIARERRKKLPENVDYWDFDCKLGENAEAAKSIHVSEINKAIDEQVSNEADSFYIEILARPCLRNIVTSKTTIEKARPKPKK